MSPGELTGVVAPGEGTQEASKATEKVLRLGSGDARCASPRFTPQTECFQADD